MGKTIKKGLSYLLTVAMVLGMFTWGPLAPEGSVKEAQAAVIPEKDLTNLTDTVQYHGINDADHTAIGIKRYKRSGCYGYPAYGYELKLKGTRRKIFGGTTNYDIMTSYWGLYGSAAKIGTSVSGGKAIDVTKENSLGSNVTVKMTFTGMANANVIRVGYVIKNSGSSAQTVSVGGTVDTDIAGDDSAKIENFQSGNNVGLISTARGGEYISFSTDGDYWYGKWTSSEKDSSTFAAFIQKAAGIRGKDPKLSSRDGTYDSCMSWLWQGVNVPAGATVTKYCYWGVGDVTEGDDPEEIKTAAAPATVVWDANADGDTVSGLPSDGRSATDDNNDVELPTLTRNGYVFEGWFDKAAAGNKIGDGGATYHTEENVTLYAHWKAIVSTVNVKLKMGSTPYGGQSVQLYSGDALVHSFLETDVTGTYTVNGVVNGTYQIAVNGKKTGDQAVVAATTEPTTQTIVIDVSLKKVTITTTLDDIGSDVPGAVTLCQNGKVIYNLTSDGNGVWKTGVIFDAPNSFDVYVGGVDTGKDVTSSALSQTIDYYTVKVNISDDEVWDNANVTLRDSSGRIVSYLPYKSGESNTAVYEKILLKSSTTLKVDVGGIDTGKTIKVGTTNEANITFYKATLNVTCTDGSLPMQATMTGDGRSYAFSTGTVAGGVIPYTVKHVLSGTDYTIETTGISTEGLNTSLQIKDDQKTVSLTVNVVNFQKYTSVSENKYTAGDSGIKDYVASGGKVKAPEIYLSGYTFDGWSSEKWTDNNGEPKTGAYSAFDFTSAVTEDKILYPHYLPPTVKINAIVRTDETGAVDTSGTDKAYRLGNLSISGFDQGTQAIRYVILTGTNISEIEAKNLSTVGATFDKDSGILEFNPLVSMETAQEYVRNSIVVTPTLENSRPKAGNITVTVIDKNGSISSGSTASPAKDNTGAKKLSGGTTGASLSGGFYYVDADATYTNSAAGGSGLTISGTVYLYIKSGCTLTATGKNASGKTAAGAGINVPSGATLYLLGEGSVVATGGNAANGTQGSANQADAKIWKSGNDYYQAGTGGAGGDGGGGAGAGIGGIGGDGGKGGDAPTAYYYSDSSGRPGPRAGTHPGDSVPEKGSNGNNGSSGYDAGTVYISSLLSVTATAGTAGTTPSRVDVIKTPDGSFGSSGYTANSKNSGWSNTYFAGRGGTGGSGAGGKAATDIGGGGAGGGGGGSGGSGHFSQVAGKDQSLGVDGRSNGGNGGNGSSTETGSSGNNGNAGPGGSGEWISKAGGKGGNGGAAGSAGGNGTLKIQSGATVKNGSGTAITGTDWDGGFTKTFNISYTKANNSDTIVGTPTATYTFGSANTFILPTYFVSSQDKFFRGWKLTTYGVELGSETDNPLASGAGILYPARHEFTTTTTTAGNLDFTAVIGERSGLYAEDTADYNTTPVKTYTVNTKVDGTTRDVGTLTFTYNDNSQFKSEQIRGLNGVYTFSNTVNNVTVKHGNEVIATLTASDENLSVEKDVSFEASTVTVKGYKPSDVTLDGGPVLTRISEDDTEKVYVYESEYRKEKEGKGNYSIRVDGTDVGKKAMYGSNTIVAYHTLTIKLAPSKASNVILKSTDGSTSLITKKVGDGQSDTFIYTLPEDTETTYDIYADGIKTGATGVKFNATRTVTADYYVTTVTIKLDGVVSDEVGIPYFGSEPMTEKFPGVYTHAWAEGTAKDIIISGNPVMTGCASGSTKELNYYSVTYEKSGLETGTVPPKAYCFASGAVNLAFNTLKNGAQNFAGWMIDGKLYGEGSEYPGTGDVPVSSAKTAVATWARQSLNDLDEHGKGATVIFDKTVFGYDGTEKKPVIEVYYGTDDNGNDIMLSEGTDYELTYLNDNTETSAGGDTYRAGTVTVTITGKGDYSGVLTKQYTIMPRLVMIKGITAEAREFDGSNNVTINSTGAELSGVATVDNNDHAKVWFDGLSGTVDSPDVEFDEEGNIVSKPVRLKKDEDGNYIAHLTGTHKSNYALAGIDGDSVTVKIEKKGYSIKADSIKANNKAYDSTTKATIKQGSAEFVGDDIPEALTRNLFISCSATFDNSNVGTDKTVTITNIELIGDAAKNYKVSTPIITTKADIVQAAQIKPAPGEGYEIKAGKIEINTTPSTRGTNYEILWVNSKITDTTPEDKKSGIVTSGCLEIDWNCDYHIRWSENENYQPSMYTDVIIDVPEGKKIATLPVSVEGLVYNKEEQIGVKDGTGYDLSGKTTGTDPGEYEAVATLQPGYVWPDGSAEQQRKIKWTIAKAPQSMPDAQVIVDPMSEPEEVKHVIKYPRGSEFTTDQPARIIEYSQDGGKSWKKLSVDSEQLELSDEDQGKTYLFRWAGNEKYEPSPAKPVKVGEWVAKPTTKAPSSITTTGAVLRAEIGFTSGESLQFEFHEKGSAWGNPENRENAFTTNGVTVFTLSKGDLTAGKLYEYRAVASKGGKKEYGEPIVFRTDSPTEGTISVDINSDSDAPVDVLVTVEEGNDPKDSIGCQAYKGNPGSVKFSGLSVGHYNVVVRTLDYTETRMLSITAGERVKSSVFTIPNGKLSSVVDVGEGAPKAAVEGLNEILSEDDRNAAAEGTKEVGVTLEMEEAVEDDTVGEDSTDKQKETQMGIAELKNVIRNTGVNNVKFIDINLFKTTTELDVKGEVVSTDVRNIGKTNDTVIEIAMPYLLAKTMRILMYRYHDDGNDDDTSKAKQLEALPKRATAGVFKDGTYFVDKAAGYIFLYSSGFSTFAICAKNEGGGNPGGGGAGGGGGVVEPEEKDKTPKKEESAANVIPINNGVTGYGAVEIYSLTSKENAELSGAVFALYDEAGNEVGRGGTIGGYLRFINVGKGTYTYKEILAPEGYKLLDKEGKITITDTKKEVVIYVLHALEEKNEPEPEKPEEETTAITIEDILNMLTDAEREVVKNLMDQYGIDEMEAIRFYMSTRMYGITEDCMKVTPDVITSRTTDKDIEGSEFGKLRAYSKKSTKKKIALKWTGLSYADGYMVFGSRCNVKGKKFKQKLLTTITNPETLSYKVEKLKKGTYHKFIVIGYKQLGSGKVTTAVSKVVHMATKGGKFTNAKEIKLKSKKSIKVKVSRVKKTKAVVIPLKKKKKLPKHRALSYESSDKSVATVTWNGRIVGVSKGTCTVYVYAQNGVYKAIKVKVTA